MKIFENLNDIDIKGPLSLALGNFDGIHLGHKRIIEKTVEKAEEKGLESGVFTFSNHPRNVIADEVFTKNIIYFEEKARLLQGLGISYLFSIPFDDEIMNMSYDEFVKDVLIGKLQMKEGFCGFNYRFGYKGLGDSEKLKKLAEKLDFTINIIEPVKVDGEIVSSTLIREMITSGKMEKCAKFLGRPYAIDGTVVMGNRVGRKLGFPTTNLVIDEQMVSPANGVYITLCTYNGLSFPSITNVGTKPTLGEYAKNVETHIFGLDSDLYYKRIHVEFVKKIRQEEKFNSVSELSKQIEKDCLVARKYFGI